MAKKGLIIIKISLGKLLQWIKKRISVTFKNIKIKDFLVCSCCIDERFRNQSIIDDSCTAPHKHYVCVIRHRHVSHSHLHRLGGGHCIHKKTPIRQMPHRHTPSPPLPSHSPPHQLLLRGIFIPSSLVCFRFAQIKSVPMKPQWEKIVRSR